MRKVYLDSAATTQMRPEVVEEMTSVMNDVYGNPSSTHSYGRDAKSLIETARKNIAAYLNVTAAEIIFTSGGTEADNLAIHSCVRDLGVERIITTRIEHHAVIYIVEYCQEKYGTEVVYLDLQDCGTPDYDHLEKTLSDTSKKTLVSLMHINNEIGNKLDIHRVGDLCKKYDALFHSVDKERDYVKGLKDYFKTQLTTHIPEIKFNGNCGDHENSTYTLLNVCLPCPADKAAMLLFTMDLKGIACSKGSACQSGSQKGSHAKA